MTPVGRWAVRRVFFRADRLMKPRTAIPVSPLKPWLGWCDDPQDANYNRLVRLPFAKSREVMWRDDGLYDVVAVLGYNDWPRAKWRGSAIFMHVARPGYTPTEGCIALSLKHLLHVLKILRPGAVIVVE